MVDYLAPQISALLGNTDKIVEQFNLLKDYMADKPLLKDIDMSDEALINSLQRNEIPAQHLKLRCRSRGQYPGYLLCAFLYAGAQ